MSLALEQLSETLSWLCVFAPFLLLGLLMSTDPASFRALPEQFADAARRVERQFQGKWQEPYLPPNPTEPSPLADNVVRLTGLTVITFSLLGLWEMLL